MWNGKTYPLDVPRETWSEFTSIHDGDYDRINSRVVQLIALDVTTEGELLDDTDINHYRETSDLPTDVQYELDSILGVESFAEGSD